MKPPPGRLGDDDVKRFADLSQQEVLALAIANEDEDKDNRIYRSFADALRASVDD